MSRASKSQSESRKLLKSVYKKETSNLLKDGKKVPKYIQVYNELRISYPFLKGNEKGGKFFPAVVRFFLNNELKDPEISSEFNKVMPLLIEAHLNDYDSNLNGLSVRDILNRFEQSIQSLLEDDFKRISEKYKNVKENPDYTIIPINSASDAKKYADATTWCIISSDSVLERYNYGGCGQFYFCIHKDYKKIPRVRKTGAPLDEYGKSMLAICVDIPSINDDIAALKSCTCRWNHDSGGNDNIMTTDQISELLGVNFYTKFKPNTKWIEIVRGIINQLKNTDKKLSEIFVEGKVYETDKNTGFTMVSINGKYNFVNEKRELLSRAWYDNAKSFSDGFSCVGLKDRGYNFINVEGNLLLDKWYINAESFSEGFAAIEIEEKKWTFIDNTGKLLTDKTYNSVESFTNNFAPVEVKNKGYSFIGKSGEIITTQYFDKVSSFSDGLSSVYLNGKGYTYINTKGEIICNEFFERVYAFNEGIASVYVSTDGKGWNFITKKGKYISKEWFAAIYLKTYGWSGVNLKDKGWNFINNKGKYISKEWFAEINTFRSNKLAKVKTKDGIECYIDRKGKVVENP